MTLGAALKKYGLLLLQDKELPSVVGIITGKPRRTDFEKSRSYGKLVVR